MIHHNDVAQSLQEAPLPPGWEGKNETFFVLNKKTSIFFFFQREKTQPDELIMSIIIHEQPRGIHLIQEGSISV